VPEANQRETAIRPKYGFPTVVTENARLVRNIRDQVADLLANRYIFRMLEEIARRNERLCQRPRYVFRDWARVNYVASAASAVRRLAGSYEENDVNLLRLIAIFIKLPHEVWAAIKEYFPIEAAQLLSRPDGSSVSEEVAARTFLGQRRKSVQNVCEEVVSFASKNIAHQNWTVPVKATFTDLDEAMETLVHVMDDCTKIMWGVRAQYLPVEARQEDAIQERLFTKSLEAEMMQKLPLDWESVFLEAWATEEMLKLGLGGMKPPNSK
jgi:hypothetical protein